MEKWSRFNIASVVLGFGFLYLPIVLLVIFSFNESKLVTVWAGFSTKWYSQLWHNQGLLDAAWVTIRVALLSATCATVLGTLAALALVRYTRFRAVFSFRHVYGPLVMPEVITGLSLLLLFVAIGFDRGFGRSRSPISPSPCASSRSCPVASSELDQSIERRRSISARPRSGPSSRSRCGDRAGRLSGWILAFTLSLDDLVIASFTTGRATRRCR